MTGEITTTRLVARFVIYIVVMAAALFGSAGTLAWPEAWLYMVLQFSIAATAASWLKQHNPELLRERMTFMKRSARSWDKAIILLSSVVFIPYLVLPGLDAVRFRWSAVPWPVEALGFVGILLALLLVARVMHENAFLYRMVEVRSDHGHRVISTGPYRYVRHPMYVGVIIMLVCLPLALGSLRALLPGVLLVVLVVIRTALEDRTLQTELAGYAAYTEQVRYRLLPGVW